MNAIRTHAAALAFAAVSTLTMLSSMQLLAANAHGTADTAAPSWEAPTTASQVIVVTGKREARS